MNEQSETAPANVPKTTQETPAAAIETAVASTTDVATSAPPSWWVVEPAQVPNVLERVMDTARSWLKTQWRNGWPLMVFLMLDSAGGWTRICGPKMRQAARALQAQHEACRDAILAHTPTEANRAWQAHCKKLSAAIGSGTITEHTGFTREDFENDYDQKLKSAHARQREIYIEFQPIAQVLTLHMVAILKERLAGMEKSERERYLQYGAEYVQSPLLTQLKKAVQTAGARATETPNATTSPRDCLPWFDF